MKFIPVEFVMPDGAVTLEEIDNSHIDKVLHADGGQHA